ncbi:MAG: TatD-related deoxyribonuclease YabD, TatD DNase family protein [Candidatus Parcubacteria bacterium]|jgi:TatD DNase family protein
MNDSPFFDTHTHVHFPIFDADRSLVMDRADEQNISMITVGTNAVTSARAVSFAHEYQNVWAAVGLHPGHTIFSHHDASELLSADAARLQQTNGEQFDFNFYTRLAADSRVVAIGECGLDYFRLAEESKPIQQEVFSRHIELSRQTGKPLMIHCRDAFPDLIDILYAHRSSVLPGVVHFFTGTVDDAHKLLDIGFSFTFGGVITFTTDYHGVIQYLPVEHILSETDAPYVAPVPYRGKRNEPAFVVETVKKLAMLKGFSIEAMRDQIYQNAIRIFKVGS